MLRITTTVTSFAGANQGCGKFQDSDCGIRAKMG